MKFSYLFLLISALPIYLLAKTGPGWHTDDEAAVISRVIELLNEPEISEHTVSVEVPETITVNALAQRSLIQENEPVPGNEADAITPQIRELARGLQNDPLRIFEYCRNHIKYEHYFGSKKGATLTLLEGGGNSFDTSALMVALLRAAGYTANYIYGMRAFPEEEMSDWLGLWYFGDEGVPFPQYTDSEFRVIYGLENDPRSTEILRFLVLHLSASVIGGFPDIVYTSNSSFGIPHMWVGFEIDSTTYNVDLSFKKLSSSAPLLDLALVTGYDRSNLLSDVSDDASEDARLCSESKYNKSGKSIVRLYY